MRPGDPVQGGEDPADCPVSPAHCNSLTLNVTHRQKETSESEFCLYSLAAGDRTIKTLEFRVGKVPENISLFYWAILPSNY